MASKTKPATKAKGNDTQQHVPPNWPSEPPRLVAFADADGVLRMVDAAAVCCASFPALEREARHADAPSNWEHLEAQRMGWGSYEFRRAEDHNLDAWTATEDVELDNVIAEDLRRAAQAKRDGTLLDEMAGNMAAVYRHMNGPLPDRHQVKIRPPRLPANTTSIQFVQASPERALRSVRVESVNGLIVGATVELDAGVSFEESTIEAIDSEHGTIAMRMQKRHVGRWAIKALPTEAPIGSVREAMTTSPGLLGVGSGRSYSVAADRDEDITERRRARARGRLPMVTRVRETMDGVTRYASAGGFLPIEYMPAKQSHNGSTGGARGEDAAEVYAEVQVALRGAALGVLEQRILDEIERRKVNGAKATIAEVTAMLNEERDRMNASISADPFAWAHFSAEQRAIREHGQFDAAEVQEIVREARAVIRRELERRGLMRPKVKERKPKERPEALGMGMPLTRLS